MLSCDSKLASAAGHLFTGKKLPFCEKPHQATLLTGCFQQHTTTWQINARSIMNISWNNPTLPCLCLLWRTLASTNCIFSYLPVSPGCFHSSPNQPNSRLLMFFLVTALGKHKFFVFNLAWYLTSFSSNTAALSSGKHTTPVLADCHQLLICLILRFGKSHCDMEMDSNRQGMCAVIYGVKACLHLPSIQVLLELKFS